MNSIFGIYSKSKKYNNIRHSNCFSLNNIFVNVSRIESIKNTAKKYCLFHSEKIFCSVIGYISNISVLNEKYSKDFSYDVELVAYLYSIKKEKVFKELEGVFSGVIYDLNSKKIILFQDEFASSLPIYYTLKSESFMFSTSLKEILKNVNKRELNIDAVKTLLSPFSDRFYSIKPNSVIPDDRTLVSEIHKLLPGQILIFDCMHMQVKILKANYKIKNPYTFDMAKRELIFSIQKQTNSLITLLKDKSFTVSALSSGYDSNLVVDTLSKNENLKEILAITIGGKLRNEIPMSQKCASSYKNISHLTKIVSDDQLNKLPEIILRNEGYVSERGLFLAYEIASLASEINSKTIFLSDCADQILNKYISCNISDNTLKTLELDSDSAKKIYFDLFYDDSINIQYDVDNDYILKKSGILLNSFSIQPIYPFLNRKTKLYSELISSINFKKQYYKNEVERTIPKNRAYLYKMGGTTDIEYLFSRHPNLVDLLLKQDIIVELLTEKQVSYIRKYSTAYVKVLLNLLVIHLFNELFITGKYDYYFDSMKLETNIINFFEKHN